MKTAFVPLVFALASLAGTAHAASVTVDTTVPDIPGDGACTWNELAAKLAGGVAVDCNGLASSLDIHLIGAGTVAATAELAIPDSWEVVIHGGGATIDGLGSTRLLRVGEGSTGYVHSLTLTNGDANYGGAMRIERDAKVTIARSTISDSVAEFAGGGIYIAGGAGNTSEVVIRDTTFSGNLLVARGQFPPLLRYGAAIAMVTNESRQGLFVESSTFSGNGSLWSDAARGGAVSIFGARARFENCTFSHNFVPAGAASTLYASGPQTVVELAFSTIVPLASVWGTAAFQEEASAWIEMDACIYVADAVMVAPMCEPGTRISNTYSFSDVIDGCLNPLAPTSQVGVPIFLGPLQDNGGWTHTHELIPGSTPMNQVPELVGDRFLERPEDQRTVLRTDGMWDSGAYEQDVGKE